MTRWTTLGRDARHDGRKVWPTPLAAIRDAEDRLNPPVAERLVFTSDGRGPRMWLSRLRAGRIGRLPWARRRLP